jgi:RNA polymerase sigma factor (TIGR02999 family)
LRDLTQILQRTSSGDAAAADALLRLLYDELRKLAAAKLAREPAGQTLQPTALVHEAWLRLGGDEQPSWQNRAHFFAAAAEAMRRILIERARRRRALRHGGGQQRVDLDQVDLASTAREDDRMLAVDEALDRLAAEDAPSAQLVKLHYFAGLTMADSARALGISEPTAYRWWAYARAWLFREISDHGPG